MKITIYISHFELESLIKIKKVYQSNLTISTNEIEPIRYATRLSDRDNQIQFIYNYQSNGHMVRQYYDDYKHQVLEIRLDVELFTWLRDNKLLINKFD